MRLPRTLVYLITNCAESNKKKGRNLLHYTLFAIFICLYTYYIGVVM